MQVRITPNKISGEIVAPASKSYAHRLLICAFLCGKRVKVLLKNPSEDVLATAGVLESLGASVSIEKDGITIQRGLLPKGQVVADCGESGSTLRFMLPLACALGVNVRFTGRGRLLERPIKPLTDVLNAHGGMVDGFTVNGKLAAGVYEIDASLSSQYVTGLMLALTALAGESRIVIKGERVSAPYIDVTADVIGAFGGHIRQEKDGYILKQGYQKSLSEIAVEGDWSNAAFALAAGAIGGNVKVTGINPDSRQGDAKILQVLESFGASVSVSSGGVIVSRNRLNPVTVDINDIPDLAQIIAVTAAFADGKSVLYNAERLKIKESDRVQAIISTLAAAGIRAEYGDGKIEIYGGSPHGGQFSGGNDHRTVMSAAILAACAAGESKITGAQAVNKSYPQFFSDLRKIGGVADVNI